MHSSVGRGKYGSVYTTEHTYLVTNVACTLTYIFSGVFLRHNLESNYNQNADSFNTHIYAHRRYVCSVRE